jgi:hypothetical protein
MLSELVLIFACDEMELLFLNDIIPFLIHGPETSAADSFWRLYQKCHLPL